MADSFVHLHLHTEYSLLDGALRIPDLMGRAKELGMPAVAMTDHGNLYGAIEFYQEAKKKGVKPIIGCEIYLSPGSMAEHKDMPGRKRNSHLTLLAASNEGYANLVKLNTLAHLDGMYYKPRVDKEALARHSQGLICLSGCISGEVNEFIQQDRIGEARQSIGEFREIFGSDRYYLELHNHGMAAQQKCITKLREFATEFGLKTVAANDVHFLKKEDHEAHDVMICIGTNANVHDEKRLRYSPEVYFKTGDQMRKLFEEVPEACDATLEIAEKCHIELKLDASSIEKYPQFPPPEGYTREGYVRELCMQGLVARYGQDALSDESLRQRLEYELGVISQMAFTSYFLIVWDFIKWAKDHGIPVGPGRGSAAGSLVAYVLGITDIDPLRFGLIFERFLNPERVSPPDVDIDFCQSRRPEVIEYVRQRYGERSVSNIITFGTMGAKSVVRDVGRVLGWSYGEGDRIAKMIPTELNITLKTAREKNPELNQALENDASAQQMWQYATFMEGLTRNVGIHAAGIVIGDKPLDNFIPLTRGADDEVVSQFAMGPLTYVGMLKMDFLGLKTLTVIKEAEYWVGKRVPDFNVADVPLDDPKAYELLRKGETVAVFQMESGGMALTCKQLEPDRIEEIIALLALYRPGPMDLIPDFIKRKKGEQKVVYLHPLLEDVSKETYGILIYQEQVQKAANLLAGYTLGAADLLRRAMGKKNAEEMAKQREIFVKGCREANRIPEKKANDIFDLLEKFAGYGFNKSHSAAYGVVTYRTAYLKANFPVEFMAAVLSFEISNTEKISNFVAECQRMGIQILPPDINKSALRFSPECKPGETLPTVIRYGLAAIKNVGESAMASAIEEREKNGPFKTADDFCSRMDNRAINKRLMEALIKVGAFDFTNETRASLSQRLDQMLANAASKQRDRRSGQVSLFGDLEMEAAAPRPADAPESLPWKKEEIMAFEKELLGFYVSGHPLDNYRSVYDEKSIKRIGELENHNDGKKQARCAGLVSRVEVKYTKKDNKPFATFALEDYTGLVEVIAWSEAFAKCREWIVDGNVVDMKARVDKDARTDTVRLLVNDMRPLKPGKPKPAASNTEAAPTQAEGSIVLMLDCARHGHEDLDAIARIIAAHPGPMPVQFQIRLRDGNWVTLQTGTEFKVRADVNLLRDLTPWMS